ncbi:hypothetical protein [Gracilimonas sp.]|uniref:hypothetical protein n=1 Tax=Gracilimonas sp. TaxID=1974203 RepID=UPI0028719AB7|nr:hypothetical protein [Gracilimonas sp.]
MKYFYLFIVLFFSLDVTAQQRPDTSFTININQPKYVEGEGPVVCIDAAHNNFHTIDGGFAPFARVIRKDGYNPIDFPNLIKTAKDLSECSIYLVANPLHESNIGNWTLPNPSAFTPQEIEAIEQWISQGGNLFLIADHMPFAGAASELGKSFGIHFSNGFATLEKPENQPDLFTIENGRLKESPISGSNAGVTTVTSFTGSAFTYPDEAIPVMTFTQGDFSLEPEVAWQFEDDTKTVEIADYAQGLLLERGEGRIAVFGEAAMFTAQIITSGNNEFKVGLNNKDLAPQNIRFLLNVMHWLDEK